MSLRITATMELWKVVTTTASAQSITTPTALKITGDMLLRLIITEGYGN